MTDLIARLLLQADSAQLVTEANKATAAVDGVKKSAVEADVSLDRASKSTDAVALAQAKAAVAAGKLGVAQDQLAKVQQDAAASADALSRAELRVLEASAAAAAAQAKYQQVQQAGTAVARLQSHEMVNLGRQLGDVATMASLGASPLTILATQGFQVAEIFSVARSRGVGFSEALGEIAGQALTAARAFGPYALAIGAVGGALWLTVDAFTSVNEVSRENQRVMDDHEKAVDAFVKATQAAQSATGDLRRELELEAESARRSALAKRELAVEALNTAKAQLAQARAGAALTQGTFRNDSSDQISGNLGASLAMAGAKTQIKDLEKAIRASDLEVQKLEQSLTRQGRSAIESFRQQAAEAGKSRGEVILLKAAAEAARPENKGLAADILAAGRAAADAANAEDARKAALTGSKQATREAAAAAREAARDYREFNEQVTQLRRLRVSELQDGERLSSQLNERARAGDRFLKGIENQIVREKDRAAAIRGGAEAEVNLAREMFIREQLAERGVVLTIAQADAARTLAVQLYSLQAATEVAALDKRAEDELAAVRMTTREREVEQRVLERKRLLLQQFPDLTEEEAAARARVISLQEQANIDAEYAVKRLREDLKAAWVEGGRLGVDELADYVETRLREAIWEAWLKEPIDIVVNAVIGSVSGLTSQILGASGAGGAVSNLLGMGMAGMTLGGVFGGAGTGAILASMLGVKGSGNTLIDGGAALGGAALGGMAGGWAAGALGSGTMAALAGSGGSLAAGGALGGLSTFLGAAGGPIGAILGIALAGLLGGSNKPNRDYARTDIALSGGRFVVGGSAAEGYGDDEQTNQIADAVAQALNAAGAAFGLDLTKAGSLQTSVGFVSGTKLGQFSPGYFGGAGGGYATGASVEGAASPEALVVAVVKDTLLRAIDAGAGEFSAAERRLIETATDLDVAAAQIQAGRSISDAIDAAMLELTDPAAFAKQQALDAVEASYQALKTQAETLIAAGLADAEILGRLETLRDLGIEDVLKRFTTAVEEATEALDPMAGHNLGMSVEDQILQITAPDIFKRVQITRDIDRQKAEAAPFIAAGLLDPGVLDRLDTLKQLRLDQTFQTLGEAVGEAIDVFAEVRPELQRWLDQFDQSGFAELNPAEQRQAAMASYERLLEKARAGDPDALNQITGAADQLLSADRDATSSSAARRALADKVKGDIAGLTGLASAPAQPVRVSGPVEISNLPELKTTVTDAATTQAQAFTTGLDKLGTQIGSLQTALVTVLEALTGETTAGFDEVGAALQTGLSQVAAAAQASRDDTAALLLNARGRTL